MSWAQPTRLQSSPIVAASGGGWHDSQAFDNVVVVDPFDATKLVLIFTGMAPPVVTGAMYIGRATASISNLTTWTEDVTNPQIHPIDTTTWDVDGAGNVRADSAVVVGTDIWLYYTSDHGNTGSKIGLAISSDSGHTWTNSGSNPILTAGMGSPSDEQAVSQFSVLREDATHWHGLYSYRNAPAGTDHVLPGIRYASSSDGLTWTKVTTDVIHQGPAAWEAQFCEWKHFFKYNGYYYTTWETGYAGPTGLGGAYGYGLTGPFGTNIARSLLPNTGWEKAPLTAALIAPSGVVGTFDRFHIGSTAMHLINGTWYAFYSGADLQDQHDARWAMGVATMGSQTPASPWDTSVAWRSV